MYRTDTQQRNVEFYKNWDFIITEINGSHPSFNDVLIVQQADSENDIERRFKCPYHKCEKFYGSEGSLNLHIKIKHNGGNKTDREKIAKSIVFAKANGMIIPEMLEVNLPPGSVEKAAT